MNLSLIQKIILGVLLTIIFSTFLYTIITDEDAPFWMSTMCSISIGVILLIFFGSAVRSLWLEFNKDWQRSIIAIVTAAIITVLLYLTIKAL